MFLIAPEASAQFTRLPQALPPSRPMVLPSEPAVVPGQRAPFGGEVSGLSPPGESWTEDSGPAPLSPPAQWLQSTVPATESILFDSDRSSAAETADMPADARDGFFQKLLFSGTWLAGGGRDGLGISTLDAQAVFAAPCPTRQWPLLISPEFAAHYLDGPELVDVPPRVYDAFADFRWLPKLSDRFRADLSLQFGAFSDFEQGSDEAFRITGTGLGIWTWRPGVRLVGGVTYLDRYDINVLPVGGVLWEPSPFWKFDLIFPKPKVARRILCLGSVDDSRQDWIYIAGDYNPHVWAVKRIDGTRDELTYRDMALILGFERKNIPGIDFKFEVGYVFGRRLHYASDDIERDLSDTVMLRGQLVY